MIDTRVFSNASKAPRLVAGLAVAIAITLSFVLGGCTVTKPSKFVDATVKGDSVVIPKADIGSQARFVNYDVGGTTVQMLAVQSTDGEPHVALNTCQSCNPSPKAFFEQDGSTLICNNCGLEFSVDTVGVVGASSCNPTPIQGLVETDDAFTVPIAMLEAYAPFFEKWRGPTH